MVCESGGTVPWTAAIRDRTLIVTCPTPYRVLSWAPLGGGLCEARSLLNHQVCVNEYPAYEPTVYLQTLASRLQVLLPAVGLMTGVQVERVVRRTLQQGSLAVECFATVGLSNALAVGDPATYEEQPGTINLIVLVNQPLTDAALAEAIAIATEAKVSALYAARVQSTVSATLATGTGTDCVAIACPRGTATYAYCGKHTRLGELLGRAVCEAVTAGLQMNRAVPSQIG